jgi:hypothetical protein
MSERRHDAVERELHGLGASIAWPEPDIAGAVASELRAGRHAERPVPRLALWPRRRVVALVVIGLLLIAGTAVAAKLAIGAISIERVPELATPTAPPATPTPDSNLGKRVTLEEARTDAGFPISLPRFPGLGSPKAVFIGGFEDSTRVSLLWPPTDSPVIPGAEKGIFLMEFAGRDPGTATKETVPTTEIEVVDVGDVRGYWIHGPHQLVLADGSIVHPRGSALLWERDGVTFRLESKLSKFDAIRLAETVS